MAGDCEGRSAVEEAKAFLSEVLTSDATSFRKAVDMTDDELAAIAARAKLTVV
jgi:hypothetical protein